MAPKKQPAKFKITNTTVKPARIVDGKDQRKVSERVGHSVQFTDHRDQVVMLGPNKFALTETIDAGLMALERGGMIRIDPIDDITVALREYRQQGVDGKQAIKTEAAKSEPRRANSVEMGLDKHTSKGGIEHEGAVNPNGDPNFVVKAGASGRAKRQQRVSSQGEV